MNKKKGKTLAIIGSGASVIYVLKHINDNYIKRSLVWKELHIFEKDSIVGMGMPYNPKTTDKYNLSNISSEEIPELKISFANWLKQERPEVLKTLGMIDKEISEKEVYSRLTLGRYLNSQFKEIVREIEQKGIKVSISANCFIIDIKDIPKDDTVELKNSEGKRFILNQVLIATGHKWTEKENIKVRHFKSPWPIFKILPKPGIYYNFTIGILGASLSAFDVATSLAHKHGTFSNKDGQLKFTLAKKANKFKIVMHDANGWLPHLQYEQKEPLRKIYRHTDRKNILKLLDDNGYLRLETYFDKICRPILKKAFLKNKLLDVANALSNPNFNFEAFIEKMSERHHYNNAFEGMRNEFPIAKESVENDNPIFWKEAVDDLMFTLNWHAELMPAEDHIFFHSKVIPFLMNVIAALPLGSAKILLALYDAGILDLVSGNVTKIISEKGQINVMVDNDGTIINLRYKLFVECGGDKNLALKDYPFKTLVSQNVVSSASATYADNNNILKEDLELEGRIFQENRKFICQLNGIDIDSGFRVIDNKGKASTRIFDLTFTHISGLRPYSYGLQACNATASIFVNTMMKFGNTLESNPLDIKEVSKCYISI